MANYGSMFDPNGNNMVEQGPAAQVREDLSQTLRSVKDTLATSFQTLNLTMSSINMTMRNIASAMPRANVQPHPNYIPAYGSTNLTGAMSGPMQGALANSSMMGIAFGQRPYNVTGMEYGWQRQLELNHRLTQFGVDATTHIGGMAMGAMGSAAALRYAGSSAAPGLLRSMAGNGLGRAAIGFGGMMGVGLIADPIMSAISKESQIYGRDIAGIRRMSTRFGNEFTNHQSAVAARGISRYGMRELMNTNDFDTRLGAEGYRNVMMQGLQQNMFQGRKPEELVKQMETAASMVKLLTGVMGSKDVQEAMQQIGQMKNMGINLFQNPQYGTHLAASTYKYSQMMGVPGSQLLQQAAQHGQQAYGAYGMPSFGGIVPAMQNMALSHELEKRKMISTAEIAAAGGHSAMAGKSVQLTAAMMQHGGLGQMMLASGWQGGGNFSSGKFNSSVGGGYFPMMGQALGNIAGNPKAYASFMMNQENLYASASAQGGLDGHVKKALFAALDGMPNMDDENSAGLMIKQIGKSMGVDVPTAVAKQWAMEKFRPNTFKSIGNEANRHRDRGFYYENAQKYHRFRNFGEAGEAISKMPSQIYDAMIRRPAQHLNDAWADTIGEPDNGPGTPKVGAGEFNANTIDNMHYLLNKHSSPNSIRTSDRIYKQAYKLADAKAGLGGKTGFWDYSELFSDREAFGMAPTLEAMHTKDHSEYFKTILNPESRTSTEAMARMSKYLKFGGSREAIADLQGSTKYHGRQYAGAEWMADQMSESDIRRITASTTGSDWYKNLDANGILSGAGIDVSNFSKEDANALMEKIKRTEGLDGIASQQGITKEKLAYALTSKSMGGDSGLSNINRIGGGNSTWVKDFYVNGAAVGKAAGLTQGAEKNLMQSETGLSLEGSQITSSLKALGLDAEDLNTVMDTLGGEKGGKQIENFGGLVQKLLNGEQLNSSDMAGISNPLLKKRLDSLANLDEGELKNRLMRDQYFGSDTRGDNKKIGDKIGGLLTDGARKGGMDRVTRGVQDIWGFDLTSADIQDAVSKGKFGDLIESAKGGSKEGKDLQSKLRSVSNGDISELREQYANLFEGKEVSDDDVKDTIRKSLLGTSLETMKNDMDTKPKKGSIESAIETIGDKGYIRVIQANEFIERAKEKLDSSTTKPRGVDELGSGGGVRPTTSLPQGAVNTSNSNATTGSTWWNPSTWSLFK